MEGREEREAHAQRSDAGTWKTNADVLQSDMALTLDDIREHCFALDPTVTEDMPFGDDVLVLRTGGKIFLLANLARIPLQVNLKCDPERAVELLEEYEAVLPGYHMNKKHWNTIVLDGSIPRSVVYNMIEHSLTLVRPRPGKRSPSAKKKRPSKGR